MSNANVVSPSDDRSGFDAVVMRALSVTAFDNCDDIWWRVDGEYAPLTLFVNCNDLFFWACSDCETLTAENIDLFEQSYKDDENHGALLFCCRVRKMRPQGAYYKYLDKDKWHLYDKCGEARETGFGNPHDQNEYA